MKDILLPLRIIHGYIYRKSCERRFWKRSAKFQNIHKGKRCFIVGNGPSLCVEDLEKLKNEICFATHRIYHIFDKTEWRPTYYCAQDQKLIKESIEEISQLAAQEKFLACTEVCLPHQIEDAVQTRLICEKFYPELPKFSDDLRKGTYEGYTVTYMCLQIAVYMGFEEIYLLGIDHSYSVVKLPDGTIETNNAIKDHFSKEDKITNIPCLYGSTLAYYAAKQYAEAHGIKIYNATRGGALDVFERVNFDEVIE